MKWCHFWIQKLLKNISFWIKLSAKWTFYLLDPEIDNMLQFLDPEIVEKYQFLDPEIVKLDTIYFWIQKLMKLCNFWIQKFFLDPEIAKLVSYSYIVCSCIALLDPKNIVTAPTQPQLNSTELGST